jgi:RHS repeat-associated protein
VQGPIASEPPTTFAYDSNGNLITTTDPLGNSTQRVYDAVSRLTALTDPRGLITQFRYDGLNRVTDIADARQGLTRFTYDPNGKLLTVVDAKNQTTTYTYDTMDRLKTRKDALNRTETYAYDPAGNLASFTDRKGQQTTFQYDALNRRIHATYPDATTRFTYDAVGRLIHAANTSPGAGAIDFRYDSLDRLIQEITGQGAVSYQYDVLGRRTSLMVNGLVPVTYQYDAVSRLTQVAQGALTVGLGYDNANRRTSLTYPNGTSTSYAYDVASRLTNITHNGPSGLIEAVTYTYDRAGNRTSLTRANGTASLVPQAVPSATYDAANEQISFAGATLTYDQNGNLTNDGMNSYTWDARNRLAGISGGATASFSYDSLGRRISKAIGSEAAQFAYDGNDIVAEIKGGAVGTTYLRSLNIDEMFGFLRQDGSYFSIYDGLGSTLALTNQAASSAVQYSYEPFGKTQSSSPTPVNPFEFTGRENDSTGLYYYRTRYYSPQLQRFLSQDRTGFSGGNLNLYGYASNSPLKYADPLGLWNTPAHDYFLKNRFGAIDPQLFGQLMAGSQATDDWLTLFLPSFSPEHAMTPIWGDKKKASEEMCNHVKNHMNQFKHYLNNDAQGLAYFHLGMALHPVMDSTSPLHEGMQRWPSNILHHGSRGEGLEEIIPELETRTLNLLGAVASGDYSVLGCGK